MGHKENPAGKVFVRVGRGVAEKLFSGSHFLYSTVIVIMYFSVILESFYNLFIYKRFERKDKIEVTSWQPCLFLRFAVSCYHCHSS